MNTNIENLAAAAAHWARRSASAEAESFVVATQTASRVLTVNMSVMISGVDEPKKFRRWEDASWEADRLNTGHRPELFYMTAYRDFCLKLVARFTDAVQTAQLADMLAARSGAA